MKTPLIILAAAFGLIVGANSAFSQKRYDVGASDHIFAKYLLNEYPKSKIAVLYQNDDSGKDYLKGLYDGLGGKLPVVAVSPYDATTPTVDSQIVTLLNSRT
jgi:hypothetical protein